MSHAPFESDSPLDDGQFFSDGKKVSCRLRKNLIVISSFVKRKPSDNNEIELHSQIFSKLKMITILLMFIYYNFKTKRNQRILMSDVRKY